VIDYTQDCIKNGFSLRSLFEIVLDVGGVESLNVVDDKGLTPLAFLMTQVGILSTYFLFS